jgi:hypothetical protein
MSTPEPSNPRPHRAAWIGGAILVLVGLYLLAGQLFKADWLGTLILPLLGVIFIVWGAVSRSPGLFVPGGILTGLGAGVVLTEGPFAVWGEPAQGGIFLISLGAGFLLITLFVALFKQHFEWWPLIPGGILGVIGGAALGGDVAKLLNYAWPLALIIVGIIVLLGIRRKE